MFVFVGSLSPWKNPLGLVRAFSTIKSGILRFIGDGILKRQLLKDIEKKNLQENVELVGSVLQNQIPNYLYNSDVLVLPSLYDGWGAVVNEALQAGCYVICSDACGACMLLEKNPNLGRAFKAGDEKELADCLNYANEHLNEIRMNREFRLKWADEYISGRVVAKYLIDCIG
jgi:glycosyltransferase involved in cell wall biosynthesis